MKWPQNHVGQKESSSMPVHLTTEGWLNTLSEEEARTEDAELVRSFAEWEARACSWPLKRLVASWNDLPGVVPVGKFTNRKIAVERIWRFFPGRRRHTRSDRDWSSDVCSSDLSAAELGGLIAGLPDTRKAGAGRMS